MRSWYGEALSDRLHAEDIGTVCMRLGVPLVEIVGFHEKESIDRLLALEVDLAVSLGNGYIPRAFFEVPPFGMINVHHELLPQFRGAQTAIWQIYHGSTVTGFTIHRINERIDAGEILARVEVPIEWRDSLRETVVETSREVQLRSVDCLLSLLDDYEAGAAVAIPNIAERSYSTPDSLALLRIYRNFRKARRRLPTIPPVSP